jgi:NAD+ kinase
MRFVLVAHLARAGAVEAVRRTVAVLTDGGHTCELRLPEGLGVQTAPADLAPLLVADDASAPAGADLVMSFGGDGTFLRASRLARDADVPVLGVNVGRLGFLAEVDPVDLDAALAAVSAGAFAVEDRSVLSFVVTQSDGRTLASGWALNDVAIEKTARQRLVRLDVSIGSTPFASMAADAVIVATSTGSTAYALSAGGPIVNPTLDAMLIAPVAPHSLFDRTVVTDLGDTVTVRVADDQDDVVVAMDGMDPVVLGPGGTVVVRGDARPVRIARIGQGEFFARVRQKFRLG